MVRQSLAEFEQQSSNAIDRNGGGSHDDDDVDGDDPHPMVGNRVRIKMRISAEQSQNKTKPTTRNERTKLSIMIIKKPYLEGCARDAPCCRDL